MKKEKTSPKLSRVSPIVMVLRMLALMGVGVALLTVPRVVADSLQLCLTLFLSFNVVTALVLMLRRRGNLWHALLSALTLAAVLLWPRLPVVSFALVFGIWTLITAVIQLTFAWQLHKTSSRGGVFYALIGVLSLAFSLSLIADPTRGLPSVSLLVGWYFVLYGLWDGVDLLALLCGRNFDESPVVGVLRIKPPVLLTALLPSRVLTRIRAQASEHAWITVTKSPTDKSAKETDDTLEIVFHLGEKVAMGFGHVDIHFDGKAYSYGNYDESSNRVFGVVSDGTFMVAPSEPYKEYARTQENKILVGYTVALTREKAAKVRKAINALLAPCRDWRPDTTDPRAGTVAYACKTLGCRYYKVQNGPFRYYNVFKTNCCAMAELIGGTSGVNLMPVTGAVTPGGYFSFLESELTDPESDVLCRTVYGAVEKKE